MFIISLPQVSRYQYAERSSGQRHVRLQLEDTGKKLFATEHSAKTREIQDPQPAGNARLMLCNLDQPLRTCRQTQLACLLTLQDLYDYAW